LEDAYGVYNLVRHRQKGEAMAAPLDDATREAVLTWLQAHAAEHFSYTLLASACGDALDLTGEAPDYTVPEEVYELAREFYPEC
jgi:hypothetical protein